MGFDPSEPRDDHGMWTAGFQLQRAKDLKAEAAAHGNNALGDRLRQRASASQAANAHLAAWDAHVSSGNEQMAARHMAQNNALRDRVSKYKKAVEREHKMRATRFTNNNKEIKF